jgi:cell division protease FtsH
MYDEAKQMLADNRDTLDRVSEALLERETLDGSDLLLLVQGLPLPALRTPVGTKPGPPPERVKAEPSKAFPGEKLPDPEPVPG